MFRTNRVKEGLFFYVKRLTSEVVVFSMSNPVVERIPLNIHRSTMASKIIRYFRDRNLISEVTLETLDYKDRFVAIILVHTQVFP